MFRGCKKSACVASRRGRTAPSEIIVPPRPAPEDPAYPPLDVFRCCRKPAGRTGEITFQTEPGSATPSPELSEEEPSPEPAVGAQPAPVPRSATGVQPIQTMFSSNCSCLAGLGACLRARSSKRTPPIGEPPRHQGQESMAKPIEAKAVPACETKSKKGGSAVRPVLSGRWRFERFEGDMEQLLVDSGLSWAIRRMAKGMSYGVGKSFVTISQDGDSIEIVTELPTKAPTEMSFTVGRRDWQTTVDAGGNPMLVKASWDGETLIMERKTVSGTEHPVVLRHLNPDSGELVEEIALSTGGKLLRFFKKE